MVHAKGRYMGRRRAGTYLGFLIIAGSLTSLVANACSAYGLPVHALSLAAAFLAALAYVSAAVLSGLAATWFFWGPSRMSPSSSLSLFALTSAVGWIWIPSVVLLSRQGSIAAALLGAMGAALMAIGLGKVLTPDAATLRNSSGWRTEARELFAQSLLTPPREGHAFIIALCIYAGFFALRRHAILAASILLALCHVLIGVETNSREWMLARKQGEPVTCRAATGPRRIDSHPDHDGGDSSWLSTRNWFERHGRRVCSRP